MKNLLILITLFLLVFVSCDNQKLHTITKVKNNTIHKIKILIL